MAQNNRRGVASRRSSGRAGGARRPGGRESASRRSSGRAGGARRSSGRKSAAGRTTGRTARAVSLRVLAVICMAAAVIIAVCLGLRLKRGSTDQSAAADGLAYLQELEGQDPAAIENVIKKQEEHRLQEQKEAMVKSLEDGTKDVWSLFDSSVILGDSRGVGFYYYGFLPESRVLAAGGNTIRDIAGHEDQVVKLSPRYVFFCYGLNDVSIGYWDTPEAYAQEYAKILKEFQKKLPDAKFYVNSILPAQPQALEVSAAWANIPEYSEAVRKMCKENGFAFVDLDQLAADHTDLYDPVDGIHLRKEFYPYWGVEMVTAVYENQSDTAAPESGSAGGEKDQ